jgi:hypothetical protein
MNPESTDDASIPDISVAAMNSTTIRTQLVRILHLRYKIACFPWKNEWFTATLATLGTTHQVPRQRTRRRFLSGQHLQAWTCMDSRRKPKQLAANAKNPGETRVYERRGQEPNFWEFCQCFWRVRKVPDGHPPCERSSRGDYLGSGHGIYQRLHRLGLIAACSELACLKHE